MGIMPPYDPLTDRSLSWAVVRVISIDPPAPTWGRPAEVVLEIEQTLRTSVELPACVVVGFGAPREEQQQRFYLDRGLGPPPWDEATLARRNELHAQMDAYPVEVPVVGARIAVWLANEPHGWTIPTLRALGGPTLPMRSRWVDEAQIPALRAQLGVA